jgi:hypothetical protein
MLGHTTTRIDVKHTLWLSELSLLNTRLESLVEEVVEHLVGSRDTVVGLDILLQGNTAGKASQQRAYV